MDFVLRLRGGVDVVVGMGALRFLGLVHVPVKSVLFVLVKQVV